ncbi:MAG TPA: MMPL family transporter [Fibrobacteraceae bacterium]|nr:MMPL family transporter [Fibrobacteraceae bacterium]
MSNDSSLFARIVGRYIRLASQKSIALLGVFLFITLIMSWLAANLKIQTDLRVLLPQGTPSVNSMEASEERMGSPDFFTIAFDGGSAEQMGQFQKLLADSLAKWPEATMVQYDQDPTFFEEHALLYFPISQLEDLRDRIKAMIDKGKAKANPFLIDLVGEDQSKPANLDGWPDPKTLYAQGLPKDVVETMLKRIDAGKGKKSEELVPDTSTYPRPSLPDSLTSRLMGWNGRKGIWVGVVMARLNQPSTNAGFAGQMKQRGEALIVTLQDQLKLSPPFRAKVVGAYRDPSSEIDQVNSDMWLSGTLAIVLILGLLAYYMRRPANVLVVFLPLLVAMSWMMGSAYLVFGRLTVLTSFVIALLSGLGIEYNIHIYSRWIEERRRGFDSVHALTISLLRTGRSLVSAMVASIVCMLALQIGHFQGFKEFGIVISMGIFFAFLSAVLLLPPLLFAVLRLADFVRKHRGTRYDWFLPSADVSTGAKLLPKLRLSSKFIRISFAACMLLTIALSFAPSVEFENDFRKLRGQKTGAGIRYSEAVAKGQSTRPSVILGKDEAQMRAIHAQLSKRFGTPQDSMLKSFVTIASFVPSESDQEDRQTILEEIRDILDGPSMQKADSATRAKANQLRKYLEPEQFGFDDLPDYAKRFITEANGTHGNFGYVYSSFRESNAAECLKFQQRFQDFVVGPDTAWVASSSFIYADVVHMVKEDSGKLAIFVFLFLAIVVLLDTRSWRGLVVNMGYIGLISLWTYWSMGWLGWKFGMFNIVVIPSLLSNTVDATIHLYHRRMEMGAGKLAEIYNNTGSSVLAGTLTNAFGFLSLCFVSHAGLRTIGLLATLGYASGILIMFFVMPFLLEILCPKAAQEGHAED